MTTEKRMHFHECPRCGGQGVYEKKVCSMCKGVSLGVVFRNKFFYFSKIINFKTIVEDNIKKYLYLGFKFLFGFLGLLGLVALIYKFYQVNLIINAEFWLSADNLMLIFWISLIFDMLLFYFVVKQEQQEQNVLVKAYNEEDWLTSAEVINWESLMKLKKVDVSKAFSKDALQCLKKAYSKALYFNNEKVHKLHILNAMIDFPKTLLILGRLEIKVQQLTKILNEILKTKLEVTPLKPVWDQELKKKLIQAYFDAFDSRRDKVYLEEIMLMLSAGTDKLISDLFFKLEISERKIINVVEWLRINQKLQSKFVRIRYLAKSRPKGGLDKAMTAVSTPVLDSFSEDITAAAARGAFFPLIGRDQELEDVFRVIEGGQNNVIIVGEDGIGKTSVLEGIAQKVINNEVPAVMQEKRVIKLSIPKLVSGAGATEVKERLLVIIDEIVRAGNIILVIPHINSLIGASTGTAENVDLSDIISNALEKKQITVIATALPQNYSTYIETSVLGSVLTKVDLKESSVDESIQVLEGHSAIAENKNHVFFSYNSLENLVSLTDRYITDKYLPQKALDLMFELAVYVKNKKGRNTIVTGEDAAELVSKKLDIPLTKITAKESEKLLKLEDKIHERVVDQEEAVNMVAESLRRARAELREQTRPIANLLFMGPTGVGKTELAKTVAEVYYGDEKNMIRLDMTEFQEPNSINSLIGVPGGQTGGYLTEAVRKDPYSLVLLDEMEKAHPDVLNIFLQVMDDGRLTDNQGRTIDFTNVILIATSNAATSFIQDKLDQGLKVEQIRKLLLDEELKKSFKPEFINRFDGIIVFKPLEMVHVKQIAQLMLNKVIEQMKEKEIFLQIEPEALTELANKGYDPQYGARPLRRVIQDNVETKLADAVIKGDVSRGDSVTYKSGGQLEVLSRQSFL